MARRLACRECGAGLRPGLAACPLCGAETKQPAAPVAKQSGTVDDYQSAIRSLKEKLRRLREDNAEAS